MAPKRLVAWLLVGWVLAGCGKGKESAGAGDSTAVDLAALRARRDSVKQASAAADSLAQARYAACTDSVTAELKKTADGRKKLATEPPAGMVRPEFVSACGKPPATGPTPTVEAAAPAAGPALTPKQQQVARADSLRRAREQAKTDSATRASAAAQADSIRQSQSDSVRQDSIQLVRETQILRETFSFSGGARDPFISLIKSARAGPEFADLLLVGIYLDLRYANNSVAIVRDRSSNRRYKLRVGDQIGRLRVSQIRQLDVVFTVEDFGFERQETLSLRKREVETP